MMIHPEYPSSDRRRLVAIPAYCLQLLSPLKYLLLPILNKPRSLISVLFHSLVLNSFMIATHNFPKVLNIMRFRGGVCFASDTSIGHGEISFEGSAICFHFAHDFSFV